MLVTVRMGGSMQIGMGWTRLKLWPDSFLLFSKNLGLDLTRNPSNFYAIFITWVHDMDLTGPRPRYSSKSDPEIGSILEIFGSAPSVSR